MGQTYYIASCIFTSKYPDLSKKVQEYIHNRFDMPIVRCCVPKFNLKYFREQMPDDYRDKWEDIPDCADFKAGDTIYSLCHNCSAILEETKPELTIKSIWELILSDEKFQYNDYHNMPITIQDCWRAYDRLEEQQAVRQLLKKMNFDVHEIEANFEKADYCGPTLYRPTPRRNLAMAPKRYVENAKGMWEPHTLEEQKELMVEHAKQYKTDKVVAYCHYCMEGFPMAEVNGMHLATLLFDPDNAWLKE